MIGSARAADLGLVRELGAQEAVDAATIERRSRGRAPGNGGRGLPRETFNEFVRRYDQATAMVLSNRLGGPLRKIARHAYLVVREDALTLYGFTTAEERDLFEVLIGVNGIGPYSLPTVEDPATVNRLIVDFLAERRLV